MTEERIKEMFHTVCDAPDGNGFKVEHLPEMFSKSSIDDCRDHVHSFYEILWIQEGVGTHTVDFVEYKVQPNTIFFIAPGQIHHFDKREGYKGVTIKMCNDIVKNANATSSMVDSLFLEYNTFHTFDTVPYYIIDHQTAQQLMPLVEEMEEESLHHGEFGNIEILKSMMCIFLARVERYGTHESQQRLDTLKPSHRLFIRFRRMVEREYTNLHTVQEYADKLNVSIRTLHKCVSECSGMTALGFINSRVVLEAKRMVRYTDLMIKEIAAELGYDNTSYFIKIFKRETGYSPTDFRDMDNVVRTYPHQ